MTATFQTAGMVQLLTPDGDPVPHPAFELDLTDDDLRGLYRDLVLVRRFDNEAVALQRQGQLGLWPPCLGQEAAQVGAGRAMRERDFCFPTYREHGVAWTRGVDPITLLGMYRGTSAGGWDPYEHGFGPYAIVLGAQVLHAVGYAMGIQRDGAIGAQGEAVLACFGDGASSQGDVNEGFVWAGAMSAPVVFLCQNNQWGISTPTDRQTRIPLHRRADGFGFPGVRVDGNDVLATYAVTRAALDEARAGHGPTLVEAFTYRMGAHTTSDDPTRYRSADELAAWQARDPLVRMKRFLEKQQLASGDFFEALDAEADQLATHVREGCLALPDPDPLSVYDGVFSEQTDELRAQRAERASYLEGFVVSETREGGQ
jgi:pyruvate dehydrogenase E1 component alpha subunit